MDRLGGERATVETPGLRKRIGRLAREVIAPLAWCYAFIKLAVFDIDSAVLGIVAPNYLWILYYKLFFLLGAAFLLFLLLGRREFLLTAAFVAGYPVVLTFWRLPRRFYREWPLIVVFLPAIGAAAARLWSTVLLYSLASLAALFILSSGSRVLLIGSIACLVPLLVVHLSRTLRKAYAASLLTRLTGQVEKLRRAIESGTFVPWTETATPTASSAKRSNPREAAYLFHGLAGVIVDQVRAVTKRRYYDIFLLTSWFYTVVLTTVLFAFAYLGLQKAFPGAYGDAEGAGFWGFIGFSLGILTTSNVSKISPVSTVASIASYAEVICSLIILVILVFSVLTAARETFRENLDDFSTALVGVVGAIETRIRAQWQLTIVELEVTLLAESPSFVNSMRRLRDLPELPLPSGAEGLKETEPRDRDRGDVAQH